MTYSINNDSSKHTRGHGAAVFGVLIRSHHAVVSVGEHAANGAEDDDGEDGDDDAVACLLVPWLYTGVRGSTEGRTMCRH